MFGLLDPLLSTILISGGIFSISFLIGRDFGKKSSEDVIEQTILYLCNEGFVFYKRDPNGEIEILKLEEYYGNEKSKYKEKEST